MTITLMQSCRLECVDRCFHSPPYTVVTWLSIKQAYREAVPVPVAARSKA
jgi:hypothetical protein